MSFSLELSKKAKKIYSWYHIHVLVYLSTLQFDVLPAEFAGLRRFSKLEFWGKLLASSGSYDKMDGRVHVLWSWLFSKISSSSIWKQPGKTQPNYFMLIHRLAHNICIVSQWTAICKLVFVGVFVRVFYPVPDAFIWPLDMRSRLFIIRIILKCLFTWATRRKQNLLARTTLTFQPNSPLLLRETDYCYKTITFHSYILFKFNQFIDTCIIICVYFLFIPFCIFVYSESVYIFIFDACCFSAILVCVSYH